jgi:hypothetical protein
MNKAVAQIVLGRDSFCAVCGSSVIDRGHLHHRKLRKHGGADCPSNLLVIHPQCHATVHANPKASYDSGFLVHSWAKPAEQPVVLHGGRTVLLTMTGELVNQGEENEW